MSRKDVPPDEAPPTTADSPGDETPPEPPAQTTAEEEGEKVPEWGKTLIDQVEALTQAVTNGSPTPPDTPRIDDNPSPKPWHKRGGH